MLLEAILATSAVAKSEQSRSKKALKAMEELSKIEDPTAAQRFRMAYLKSQQILFTPFHLFDKVNRFAGEVTDGFTGLEKNETYQKKKGLVYTGLAGAVIGTGVATGGVSLMITGGFMATMDLIDRLWAKSLEKKSDNNKRFLGGLRTAAGKVIENVNNYFGGQYKMQENPTDGGNNNTNTNTPGPVPAAA
jgi:hypothetical protein